MQYCGIKKHFGTAGQPMFQDFQSFALGAIYWHKLVPSKLERWERALESWHKTLGFVRTECFLHCLMGR
jgi:hypothetical protein